MPFSKCQGLEGMCIFLSKIFSSHPFKAIFWVRKSIWSSLRFLLRCRLTLKLQGFVPCWRVYYSWNTYVTIIVIFIIFVLIKVVLAHSRKSRKNKNHKEENKHNSWSCHLERTTNFSSIFLNYFCIYIELVTVLDRAYSLMLYYDYFFPNEKYSLKWWFTGL